MLLDPLKGVLVPLTPEEASAASGVPVTFGPGAICNAGVWTGLPDVVVRSGSAVLPLGGLLALLPALPDPASVRYEIAYSSLIGNEAALAGACFASLALSDGPVAPSLYGLALALEKLGAQEESEALAAFVADLPGYDDPRAAALAGYAAFQLRHAKTARIHLAKAARIARTKPEFRGVQRFAQRVLLVQQFAPGD